MSKVWPSCHR